MHRKLAILVALIAVLGSIGCASARAGQGIPIIVMAEDSDPDSVRRSSDVFYRVVAETQEVMRRYDFLVLDEHFIAGKLGWRVVDRRPREELVRYVDGACQRDDATLCARAMVLVKIRADVESSSFGKMATVRLTGDVFDQETNSYLGGWEPVTERFPAPRNCDRVCLDDVLGDNARQLASSLADVLRRKLAYLLRGRSDAGRAPVGGDRISTLYKFNFRYFSQGEILEITDTMEREFPCFEQVRGTSGDTFDYVYDYSSCAPVHKLQRWMAILLHDMGLLTTDYQITVSDQREIRVEKLVESSSPSTRRGDRFN